MRFASLGSGSAGNCMVIEQASTRLLLDCGFSANEIAKRLQILDLKPEQISGVLVTHEHDDHAKGAFKFAAKFNVPVWLSHGSLKMCERYMPAASVQINIIDSHTLFSIEDIEINPYPVPHDAREPTQFTFSDGNYKLGVLTDAGSSTAHIEYVLSGCDALVLECNHDLSMLENGPYAWTLKKRVGSRLGHLDNQSAAALLERLDNGKLKHILAAHLSAKNNTADLAKRALSQVLNCTQDWVGIAEQDSGFTWRGF
ncbi:MAG TPA: MBL fold metallo-hydrolase [Methylotenera sp.]|nr:MBL fold metallo-hydrolase [Methylotenera sp.]